MTDKMYYVGYERHIIIDAVLNMKKYYQQHLNQNGKRLK